MSFRTEQQIQEIVNISKAKYYGNVQLLAENWQEGLAWDGLSFSENQLIAISNQIFVSEFIGTTLSQKNVAADQLNKSGYADYNRQFDYAEDNYVDDYVQ